MMEITEKRLRYLQYIHKYPSATLQDMATYFDVKSSTTAHHHLSALIREGYLIKRGHGIYELTKKSASLLAIKQPKKQTAETYEKLQQLINFSEIARRLNISRQRLHVLILQNVISVDNKEKLLKALKEARGEIQDLINRYELEDES